MVTIHGGGTSRKRMHAARDFTGGEIMKTLKDEVLNRDIPLVEFASVYELLTDGDRVTGAVLYNMETEEYMVVRAKTAILATGGGGRLHVLGFPTSNHYGATGDGLVLGYRVGAPLKFMDTIQYHPTGAAYPEQILGLLVTEKVRSIGGQITNIEGNRFVYELETRDVEAAAIIRECAGRSQGGRDPVRPAGRLARHGRHRDEARRGRRQGARAGDVPPVRAIRHRHGQAPDPHLPDTALPERRTQDRRHVRDHVASLYAAGEVAGGIHGTNRLMGNSLLDVVVFGRRAGAAAAAAATGTKTGKPGS